MSLRTAAPRLLCLMLLALWACQTSPPPEPEVAPLPPSATFKPAEPVAHIKTEDARYPNLFAPESYAVWISPEVAATKRVEAVEAGETIPAELDLVAEVVNDRYYVFECRIESVFEDTSIAYDSVGLRGIDVYMTAPSGYKVLPIQKIIDRHADEEQAGALRRFGRTNILVFPKRDVLQNGPALPAGAPSVRLVLEGHNSVFYFEWFSGRPAPESSDPGPVAEVYDRAKTGFTDLYSKLRTLAQMFH